MLTYQNSNIHRDINRHLSVEEVQRLLWPKLKDINTSNQRRKVAVAVRANRADKITMQELLDYIDYLYESGINHAIR